MKEFVTRTLTASVLIAAVFALIQWVPYDWFALLLFLLISLGAYELVKLAKPKTYSLMLIWFNGLLVGLFFAYGYPQLEHALVFILLSNGIFFLFSLRKKEKLDSFVKDIGVHFLAVFYLYFPLFYLLELKNLGPHYVFFLVFTIAIGDSGAYFIGSALGRHKIYPVASPNKSFEGLIAAIVFAGMAGWLVPLVFPVPVSLKWAIISGAIIGLMSQLSDPIESLFKRAAGKKDSGNILPGHGGILDRIDSYIFCAPVIYYIIQYLW